MYDRIQVWNENYIYTQFDLVLSTVFCGLELVGKE